MNVRRPPSTFSDEHGKAQKPVTVEDYSSHLGCQQRGQWVIAIQLVGVKTYFFISWT